MAIYIFYYDLKTLREEQKERLDILKAKLNKKLRGIPEPDPGDDPNWPVPVRKYIPASTKAPTRTQFAELFEEAKVRD